MPTKLAKTSSELPIYLQAVILNEHFEASVILCTKVSHMFLL
jgi:hypothetical protein